MIRGNLLLVLISVVLSLISISSPYLLGEAIDRYGRREALPLVMLASLCIVVVPCLKLLVLIYVQRVSKNTRFILKKKLLSTLLEQNFTNLSLGGQVIDLVDGDVEGALYLYHRVYYDVAFNISLIVMSLCVVAYIQPQILLAPLAAITLSGVMYCLARRKAGLLFQAFVQVNCKLVGHLCDDIRLKFDAPHAYYNDRFKSIQKLGVSAQLRSSILGAFSSSSYMLGIVLLFLMGGGYFYTDKMTSGELFSSVIYVERVLSPTSSLVAIYFSVRESSVRFNRIKKTSRVIRVENIASQRFAYFIRVVRLFAGCRFSACHTALHIFEYQ